MRFNAFWTMVVLMILLIGPGRAQRSAARIAPPGSFEAIAASPSEIRCYWLPAPGSEGYRLSRDGMLVADLPATATEYIDRTVQPGSLHRYAIKSVRFGRDSGESPLREYSERSFATFPSAPPRKSGGNRSPGKEKFDVVIIQASSGGVAAAIEAGRRGLSVALVEATARIGGMPVNGLSATDLRRPEHASGFVTNFRDRVKSIYASEDVQATGLQYEPRVAHQAMKSLLYEIPSITLYRETRLRSVRMEEHSNGRRIESVMVEELNHSGLLTGRRAELSAKVFVDATDCGDLAAWAGAPYRIGREPRSPHEPHNGVIYYDRKNDKLLPGSTGHGDRRLQSYAYLVTVKDYGPGTNKTIPIPAGYHKEDYDHSPAWKDSWAVTSGKVPNGKYELNQHPQGGDLQEINYKYPETNYRDRGRTDKLYRDRGLGYLYYIQTEQGQKQIGLPDDEYRDSGGFPSLLYVREGRRIVGEQLPNEADVTHTSDRTHPESIGLGDYPMDSHAVRRKTDWSTPDMGEGEWWLYQYTPNHELPLGVIVPKALDNVFVTTAVSSTHVSFGTYRMEPVRMAFGQAAGIGAYYCIHFGLSAKQVPARQIQDELLPHFANRYGDSNPMLTYFADVKPSNPYYRFIHYMAARGFRPDGDSFRPDAPTTKGELTKWLKLFADRTGQTDTIRAAVPLTGAPEEPASRGEIAIWLGRILPILPNNSVYRYGDLGTSPAPLREGVNRLLEHGIDATQWDSWSAYAPDGSLRFRPESPITHEAMFATLYLANIGFGPSFFDQPADAGRGRQLPPIPETSPR